MTLTPGDPLNGAPEKPQTQQLEFVQPEKTKKPSFWSQLAATGASKQDQKAAVHQAKAGKTFRRTGKHVKKAAKAQRTADRMRGDR